MNKNWALALVVAFALGVSLKVYFDQQSELANQNVQSADSSVTLFGADETPVNLYDQADSRVRVIYFGFTRCPDVCPTSLAMLAGALNQLDDADKQQFRPLFISLDPERDAPQLASEYASYFHKDIEGLSAPLDVTKPLASKYGVIFRKTELEDSALEYTLDHSSYFYFLKPDGSLITKVPHALSPAPVLAAMKDIIKNNQG
ncbi:SCO family protein [Vibrio nigripulchritudo]|uniref:SCO family protein n=1 Tax=Vibrio nigripulchritudo TaxID=28173 RepID=UPI0005FA0CDA|nr:SCO family protein [Vibrio nigripulchritudo]KJY75139.1 photosynthetic protein synthase I [Vibrio nigripulchritudo]